MLNGSPSKTYSPVKDHSNMIVFNNDSHFNIVPIKDQWESKHNGKQQYTRQEPPMIKDNFDTESLS